MNIDFSPAARSRRLQIARGIIEKRASMGQDNRAKPRVEDYDNVHDYDVALDRWYIHLAANVVRRERIILQQPIKLLPDDVAWEDAA